MIRWKPLIISILISLGVGGLSAMLTVGSMEKYGALQQPALAPPASVFPIVWTILFILMGISAYLVYVSHDSDKKSALIVYVLQLIVNFFWSLIFFNGQMYLFAFLWLILLWVLIVLMIIQFYKVNPCAAYLQIPYLLWVTFAGYLNIMIYFLNR